MGHCVMNYQNFSFTKTLAIHVINLSTAITSLSFSQFKWSSESSGTIFLRYMVAMDSSEIWLFGILFRIKRNNLSVIIFSRMGWSAYLLLYSYIFYIMLIYCANSDCLANNKLMIAYL